MGWAKAVEALGDGAEAIFARGVRDVIDDQVGAGIDIPTDGEVRRENYIHYHCRHLDGIDFENLTEKMVRGVYAAKLPTVTGPVAAGAPFLPHDWRGAQACTERPVKITMPGPMTISDTVYDGHYGDPKAFGADLAVALNAEVLALAEAGCRHIQIDEPVFARKPDEALDYGFENLERCFHGCPEGVVRTVHMCCGYPDRLDNPDYPKAPRESYQRLAPAIEDSSITAVSIEDAHRHNDLSLLEVFGTTTVILGVVAIAKSRVETVEEIAARLQTALAHIDADRLIAAPDCGLGILGRDLALRKLRNLCEAAHSLG
jgi:5-methyltetrahydropteroyltriglutamate--homocysteine methyltransferase